jgi:hypothetical protein
MRAAHGSAVDRHQNKILAFATNSIEQASIEIKKRRRRSFLNKLLKFPSIRSRP